MEFNEAFDRLIGHEGGYVDHPNDPGGETKYGISKRSYPDEDIKNLTLERALFLYRRDFWDRLQLEALPSYARFQIFDAAVNSGAGTAARLMQRAAGVAEDGRIGPISLRAIRSLEPAVFIARFNAHRLEFLTGLSTWPTFGKGWTRRAAKNLLEV